MIQSVGRLDGASGWAGHNGYLPGAPTGAGSSPICVSTGTSLDAQRGILRPKRPHGKRVTRINTRQRFSRRRPKRPRPGARQNLSASRSVLDCASPLALSPPTFLRDRPLIAQVFSWCFYYLDVNIFRIRRRHRLPFSGEQRQKRGLSGNVPSGRRRCNRPPPPRSGT